MEITVDYLKDKVHEQYLELQELRKSYDELTKSALRLDKMVKEKQEEIDQLKTREKEHQRLNGELRVEIERLKEELKYTIPIVEHNKTITKHLKEIERLNNIINELKWKPIEEYDKGNYDWVLVKYFDGDYECVPCVAEKRFGKWHSIDEKEIKFDVKYFMDMQQIDKLQELKGSDKE